MKLLPLGTIINVNEYKLCIIGYSSAEKDSASVAGYLAVSYPLGFINIDKTFFIPHYQEDLEVIAEGYKTEESEEFLGSVAKIFESIQETPREDLIKACEIFKKKAPTEKGGNEA